MPRTTGIASHRSGKLWRKSARPKRRAWNKGIELGQKDAFTSDQVKQFERSSNAAETRGSEIWLFSRWRSIPCCRGRELLNLTVKDVRRSDGTIWSVIEIARRGRKPAVRCALSEASANALEKWIAMSGKKRTDYIFSGRGDRSSRPMTVRQVSRLLRLGFPKRGSTHIEFLATDKGSPHLQWDRRYRDSPGALGPQEDQVHSALPAHRQKDRPNRNFPSLSYLISAHSRAAANGVSSGAP